MPKGTQVFAPSGFPYEQAGYVLAAHDPGFTHDEFTVASTSVTTYVLHQTPKRYSVMVALAGKLLSENREYTVNYDAGEFTISATQHVGDKIEARYVVDTLETVANIQIHDAVSLGPVPTVTDSAGTDRQVPLSRFPTESINDHETTAADNISTGVALITISTGVVDADDGWTSTVPGFSNTGPTVQVGNSAGEIRNAFMRFPMPHDLAGRHIVRAVLRVTPDAATAAPGVKIRFQADTSGVAAAPTTKADYDGRTLTTSFVDWQTALVAGVSIDSPDLSSIVQEVASAGTTTDVLLMLHDNSSATDFFAQLRSFGHSTGPIPQLIVTFD